ncbi:Putative dde superfamily endonuclease [Caligus rogercresseyi]|uniref:Dde superfamily endonuclease n=1 Tax=Caligus rogercresseyi TaxID=217165 RepID=A0A7T8KEZ5_CALRO|nr:Putative dde superfamily endonuclease [Caligus rogercresseyi]
MSEGSMRNLVKKDLGMTPRKKIMLQLLSEATIEKRRERGRILLNKLKSGTQGPVFYTDEKLFTVQAVYNSQNDRILAKSSADIPVKVRGVFRRQKPKSVMVWAGVMSDGTKSPLTFVPEGVKINKEVYLSVLNDQVLPWIKAEYGKPSSLFSKTLPQPMGPNLSKNGASRIFLPFGTNLPGHLQALILKSWTSPCDPYLKARLVLRPTEI